WSLSPDASRFRQPADSWQMPRDCTHTLLECTGLKQLLSSLMVMEVPLPAIYSSGARRGNSLLVDPSQLRTVLSNLSHELCRQLASLRAGFDLILSEGKSNIAEDQSAHLLKMVSLCDEMLGFTRSSLDYAAIAHGSRPLCLGSFTIRALIEE